jgi:hypothetical protein
MVKWWHILVALVVGVFVGLLLGREHSVVTTHTTVDTVVHYKPLPTAIATTEVRTISMPRLLFAPADTVHTTTVIVKGESVELQVPIERREYRDSSYYAVVSGAVVGDIHPTLEHIETYAKNTVQTTYVHPPKVRPYISGAFGKQSVGAGAGILICNKHAVGVDYTYAGGKGNLMARYSFVFR